MFKRTLFILLMVALLLAACGGGSQPAPAAKTAAGNADSGKAVFTKATIGAGLPGCAACHSLEKGKTLVGPSMAGIATEAEKIIKEADYKGTAKTAADYLRESIVNPDAYVAKGFTKGIMIKDFGKLAEQELADLVAYLTTLK